jgi:hypothetical protein
MALWADRRNAARLVELVKLVKLVAEPPKHPRAAITPWISRISSFSRGAIFKYDFCAPGGASPPPHSLAREKQGK